jgi:hypothetical protein
MLGDKVNMREARVLGPKCKAALFFYLLPVLHRFKDEQAKPFSSSTSRYSKKAESFPSI